MSLERMCKTDVVTVSPGTNLIEVACLMRSRHVGSIVVVEDGRPVGILTDRDIVVNALALGVDPRASQAKEVMTPNPVVVNINYDARDATQIMREMGLRRLPVVDENRRLLGIVSLDDLLGWLGDEIANLAGAVKTELAREGT